MKSLHTSFLALGLTAALAALGCGDDDEGTTPPADAGADTAVRTDGRPGDAVTPVDRPPAERAPRTEGSCTQPIDLTLSGGRATFTGSTASADNSVTGSCGGGEGFENVHRLTLPAGGPFLVQATTDNPATTFDTVVYFRTECAGQTDLACNDDINFPDNTKSLAMAEVPGGTTIFFVVDAFVGQGQQPADVAGGYQLDVTVGTAAGLGESCAAADPPPICVPELACTSGTCQPPAAAQAACTAATDLTLADNRASVTGALADGTNGLTSPCGFNLGSEIVYHLSLPAAASRLVVETQVTGETDTLVFIRRVCGDPTTQVEAACNDDIAQGNLASRVELTSPAAGDYYIIVEPASLVGTGGGQFTLQVTVTP